MKDMDKAEAIHKRMLNQLGISELAKMNIYKDLALSLRDKDFNDMESNHIFLNPIFSPASKSDLNIDLPKGSIIITIDINSLKKLNAEEGIAIILHEIGHALNPFIKEEQGEFVADDFAKDRNYRLGLISALEMGEKLWPEEFKKEITDKRISRLN